MQIMGYYAAGDSDACLRIHHRLLSMMLHDKKDPEHKLIYLDLDYYAKVTMALAYAEYSGMRLDSKYALKEVQPPYLPPMQRKRLKP